MTSQDDSSFPEDTLPEAVIRQLQESDHVPFDVSADQHRQILQAARSSLPGHPRHRSARRWIKAAAVLSSVCAALLLVVTQLLLPETTEVEQAMEVAALDSAPAPEAAKQESAATMGFAADPKDIDENGTVDILDAYLLARRLESGESEGHWDFNSDGELNKEDVRLVAQVAVTL